MNEQHYNDFCQSLLSATYVNQWGGAHVWKIGGKVFSIGGWNKTEQFAVTFKVVQLDFEILKDHPGCQPAPYLASRGFTWIQRFDDCEMKDKELKQYIEHSYQIVAKGLTKKKQKALGITHR